MDRILLRDLTQRFSDFAQQRVLVKGWLRTVRNSKTFGFMELNDGSCFRGCQIVFEEEKLDNYAQISKLNVGAAVEVEGVVVVTPEMKQPFEIKAEKITIAGESTPDYPLQKKRHSPEFLRQIAHLRPRTNLFSAVFRVRSAVSYAIHRFFPGAGVCLCAYADYYRQRL